MYFRELNKQYGKIVRVRLGPNQTVMLFDPELISQTIANEGAYPVRRSVPIMETYVKRTKRNMLSVQYVHSIHNLLPYIFRVFSCNHLTSRNAYVGNIFGAFDI